MTAWGLLTVALSLGLAAAPAEAQDTATKTLVVGMKSPDAGALGDKLWKIYEDKVVSKCKVFVNKQGLLSVHPGVSERRLRDLALTLEKQKGVRQALTDGPRRMILLIFKINPKNATPDVIAGPLEEMRRHFRKNQGKSKTKGGRKGTPGAGPGSGTPGGPDDSAPKNPKDPQPLTKPPIKPGPKRRKGKTRAQKRHYSSNPTKLTDEQLDAVKVYGEITGKKALALWLSGKDRLKAAAMARKRLKKRPKDWEAGAVMAMYHLHKGDTMKAYRNMRTVIHYRPHVAAYREMYAEVLYLMNLDKRAEAEEQKARELIEERKARGHN